MSRIGNKAITIPEGVEVTVSSGNEVTVKGPKGTLTRQFSPILTIEVKDGVPDKNKEPTVAEINAEKKNLHIETVKEISEQENTDSQISKWQDGLEKFTDFIIESETRKSELLESMSNIDKEVVDIEHYIELNNLNACQGFLAYKMLRNRLRKRRKIKNELQVLSQLGNCKIDSAMMKDVQDAIKLLEHKKYTPRVLVDLFN